MTRPVRQRLHAVALLTLFVGSGTALPALDELLYHMGRDSSPPAGVAHFDAPGGCGAHSEHCVLVASASVRQHAANAQHLLRTEVVTTDYVVFHPVVSLRTIDRSLLQPSRAPPVIAS
ncbi:MAG TPA: hypothetical protein VGR09_01960 [Gemmatimonadales bacterium]|nr:hypothetical protein [Gemmatimonadales bacterium]